jgi:hypothetical protein
MHVRKPDPISYKTFFMVLPSSPLNAGNFLLLLYQKRSTLPKSLQPFSMKKLQSDGDTISDILGHGIKENCHGRYMDTGQE